jgi:hypothetical protein
MRGVVFANAREMLKIDDAMAKVFVGQRRRASVHSEVTGATLFSIMIPVQMRAHN